MHVLIVKTSSMGDIIHTLPALTDASLAIPEVRFDWVCEQSFCDLAICHPHVNKVIPIAWRRWRKNLIQACLHNELKGFYQTLRHSRYHLVIDAQGLIKSALIARVARGSRIGFDCASARERLASAFYQKSYAIDKNQHALIRTRMLFAQALNYPVPQTLPDYRIDRACLPKLTIDLPRPYVVLLHGTTWKSKHWPEMYWHELAKKITDHGYGVVIPWGNVQEQQRAARIAQSLKKACILPRCNLSTIASILLDARFVVSVDTGLGHLAAALSIPNLSIYGATNPHKIGTIGKGQQHLICDFPCAPCLKRHCHYQKPSAITPACYQSMTPEKVWQHLQHNLSNSKMKSYPDPIV